MSPPALMLLLISQWSSVAPLTAETGERPKALQVHVYGPAGDIIRTWRDIASRPSYRWSINGGPQPMALRLPRAWGTAGEKGEAGSLEDLALDNRIDTYVIDKESGSFGQLMHSGFIERYMIPEPADEGVEVMVGPLTSLLRDSFIAGPVEFTDEDPADMAAYVVANHLPGVTFDGTNPLVGFKFNLTLENVQVFRALEMIRRLAGSQWFYRLNPDNTLTFNFWDLRAEPDHVITGLDFSHLRIERSREDVKTRGFLFGAKEQRDDEGNVTQPRITATITTPRFNASRPRDLFYSESRITDFATARRVLSSLLEFYRIDAINTEIEIPDSNYDSVRGYDIESLKPGQTLGLRHPRMVYQKPKYNEGHLYDNGEHYNGVLASLIQGPLVIAWVEYGFTSAKVQLTTRPAPVVEELVVLNERQLLESSA